MVVQEKAAFQKNFPSILFAVLLAFLATPTQLMSQSQQAAAQQSTAQAQQPDDKKALEEKVEKLTKALEEVQARLDAIERNAANAGKAAPEGNPATQEDSAQQDAAALRNAESQDRRTNAADSATIYAAGPAASRSIDKSPLLTAVQLAALNRSYPAPGLRPGSTSPSMS